MEAGFLDSGGKVNTLTDRGKANLTVFLPDENHSDQVRIIRLVLRDDIVFNTDSGPDYSGKRVHHVTHSRIVGRITDIDLESFTIQGNRVLSGANDHWILEEKETVLKLSLNDHTRYRINDRGDIRQVQGYELSRENEYSVVFSPYEEGPELEIITELRK